MIILDSSVRKLQLVLAGAKASVDCPYVSSFVSMDTATYVPGSNNGVTNGVTAVDAVTAPSGGQRQIKMLTLFNQDTAAVTVSVIYNDNGTQRILYKCILQVGEALCYNDGEGFISLDASGSIKSGIAPGRFLKRTLYTNNSATTHTFVAGCGSAIIEAIACGGGGGGCSWASSNMAFAGGGAAGGYFSVRVLSPTTATVTVSATGGTAGTTSAGTGGTGADAVVVVGGVTYTAKGGLGGVGMATGATLIAALGGAGVLGTNGDINVPGAPGGNSQRSSGLLGVSGDGASTIYGSGGVAQIVQGAGIAGRGFGAGGSGASAVSAAVAGGAGAPGIIIITEYS